MHQAGFEPAHPEIVDESVLSMNMVILDNNKIDIIFLFYIYNISLRWRIYIVYSIKLQKNVTSVKQNARMLFGDGINISKK